MRRRMMLVAVAALAGPLALAPRMALAEDLFGFLFGGAQRQQQQQRQAPPQANFFADPFGLNQQPAPPPPRPVASSGSGPAFCVRTCDGRYFPLARGNASPVAMCQAFCPASATRVFFGSTIDGASSSNGERYADSENAFAFRKALRADCTCNGRDPAGLAPVDLTLDTLAASRRRDRHHHRPRGLFRRQGRHQPDRRIHAGGVLSGPDLRGARAARRNEGGAGRAPKPSPTKRPWLKQAATRAAGDLGAEDGGRPKAKRAEAQ